MGDWYESSFGPDYMVIYRHRDWDSAAHEVRLMASWLALEPGAAVLDVGCGSGRHSMALSGMGYRVTGVDLSDDLLREARRRDAGSRVEWVKGDMRRLPFADGSFDATVNLFTSFGYFVTEEENTAVLGELRRVLRSGGKFLIDFLNPLYVERNLVPETIRVDEETGWTITEKRRIREGCVVKTIVVDTGANGRRVYEERVRLYTLSWFDTRLTAAGLRVEETYGGYDGSPYVETESDRLILRGSVGA